MVAAELMSVDLLIGGDEVVSEAGVLVVLVVFSADELGIVPCMSFVVAVEPEVVPDMFVPDVLLLVVLGVVELVVP